MDSATPRKVPMQVLSLGMGRTGTCSMQAALHILGFRHTYHGFDTFEHPEDFVHWERAADAKFYGKGKPYGRKEFDEFLGHCAGTTDFPALFAEDLIAAYPEAKVVLVERDIDKWYKSFDDAIISTMFSPIASFFTYVIESILGTRGGIASRKVVLGYFRASNAEELRRNAKPIYVEHYAKIRRLVPPERLLNYELGSGWGPLCEFLGKEIPEEDFPWVNETSALRAKIAEFQKQMLISSWRKLRPMIIAGFIAWAAYIFKSHWYSGRN